MATPHSVTLQWNPNPEPNVSYNVIRGKSSKGELPLPLNPTPLIFGPGVQPTFTDPTVLPGVEYFYEVDALSGSLTSPVSNEVFTTFIPFDPTVADVPLGRASSFGVLGGTTVTATGPVKVAGDVGVAPGTSITGFDIASQAQITGSLHIDDLLAQAAQADLVGVYNTLKAATNPGGIAPTNLGTAVNIGGMKLGPGVYFAPDSMGITGNVILDAGGNPDAVWIFQIGTALTVAGAVILQGGAQAAHVYWQVGSSATIGTNSAFSGILVAFTSITAVTGASIDGQLLAMNGAVTLDSNSISMLLPIVFIVNGRGMKVALGNIFFDCATGTYQEAIVAGTTALTAVAYNPTIGGTTQDGTVTWMTLDPPGAALMPLPPSQNVPPPSAPSAPTGLKITAES
jgi:hypothetical protein